ncbi:hypothetical protein GCM10007036_36290 [Alsobacter metallidurans]|uniref:Uncharacterized protein n=1 Tax=Alsobacter metallidurans TaxID=340221 RepID=A0A917IBJ5_9HYPH|nr:hypothetical protein GCM10007036_36290 [Alsobacter metallidurans]
MNLLAEPALRADAEAVAHQQHSDHQLRVDRWPTHLAVEGTKGGPDAGEIHEPVYAANEVISRDMSLQAELVEQRFLSHRPFAHHRVVPQPKDN